MSDEIACHFRKDLIEDIDSIFKVYFNLNFKDMAKDDAKKPNANTKSGKMY